MPAHLRQTHSVGARHNEITAGVIGNIIRDLACLPKGWLE
jgi:hypothetical protein